MKQELVRRLGIKRRLLAAGLAFGFGLSAGAATAAESLNRDADEILRSMSTFLAGTKSFSVSADISNEFITLDAQKLQLNGQATVLVERPSRFYAARKGRFADAELIFDGNKLTIYGKTLNSYVQKDLAGTIEQAISALESASGVSLPGADLLFPDPYAVLSSGITSSGYYGRAYVGGVQCHHLAFRTEKVDWQIWVKDGDEPLPMKYVITSKWMAGAPQYSVELSNWDLKPVIPVDRFGFVAPQGAKKLEALAVDEAGEFTASEESK
jgi:hypothetical protein